MANAGLLGTDLTIASNGDIGRTGNDFAMTVDGATNVTQALIRELTTPFGALGQFIYDVEGLKILGEDYGNLAYDQLSEPISQSWIDGMVQNIKDVAESQPRIVLKGVEYALVDIERHKVHFFINFEILETGDERNLVLEPRGSTLAVVRI